MPKPAATKHPLRRRRNRLLALAALLGHLLAPGGFAAEPAEVFEFGDFALYAPAHVPAVRGILLALGGPDTRAFASGGSFDAPKPELEASLHIFGQELRALVADHGLAILGTSRQGKDELPNLPRTDAFIFETIGKAAAVSDRPELSSAPLIVYGISGGTPQAIGFAARNPQWVGALLLKVPAPPGPLRRAHALAVPTYIILAEDDAIADNEAVAAAFESNRRAGGLWALAVEPGVPHHSLSPGHRALSVNWLRAIVELRLGALAQDPMRNVAESSGWLGHPNFGVWDWVSYPGDRRAASWFPNQATAEEWWAFMRGNEAP